MYELEKVRRNHGGIEGVAHNILSVSLISSDVKHVDGVASSRTHLIQNTQIFAKISGATVQSH